MNDTTVTITDSPNFPYRFPKRSKKQQVLDKHGYEEKVYHDGITMTRFLVPVYDNVYDKIANLNEGEEGPAHFTGSIVFKPNETVKELFLRLGWITEDGQIL